MWPAVPTTTWRAAVIGVRSRPGATGGGGEGGCQRPHLGREHGAAVEQQPVVGDATDDRRLRAAKGGIERARRLWSGTDGHGKARNLPGGEGAAAHLPAALDHDRAESPPRIGGQPAHDRLRSRAYDGGWFGQLPE